MQMSLTFARDGRLPEILKRLRASWPPRGQGKCDPLSQLIFVIVAARAPGASALAAFQRLKRSFPRWHDVKLADLDLLTRALAGVEDAREKAKTIQNILREIEKRHEYLELDFLSDWSTSAARQFLESLPGVGPTASAATLNFSTLQRTVLSVSDETARPVRRLGIVPEGAVRSSLDRHIIERMPTEWQAHDLTALHQGLEKLARHFCHHGRPACKGCPLSDLCPTARRGAGDVVQFKRRED